MIIKGQKINDRYQIIRMIGEGGMANVYLAYDTILERNVAVKILRGDLAEDEKFVRRFQREAISASSLTHPNIVEMYDVGEDDGKYFIVMEYVDGKTLKSLVKKRGRLSLPEVIDIMLQLTSAIACAHDSYIIHRDIKPQNVLVLDDGRVKITDFGISLALNSNELTQTNSVMGSVYYLPPEQANGSGATIKSDIYSLGILMYELLTGKLPFKGENAVEIAIKQMREPLPSVCSMRPEIPQSIENVLLKACAKNLKNRYNSVNEMREDIKTALNEDRLGEPRHVYVYPEQDLEETKKVPTLTRTSLNKQEQVEEEIKEEKKDKKINIALFVTIGLSILVALGFLFAFLIYPMVKKVPDVIIPDVSDMTIVNAEKKLKEYGLEVSKDIIEKSDEEIEKENVIRTEPRATSTVKKGSLVTLIVSTGPEGIKLEDYTGKNYLEVKGALESKGLHVIIEKKTVEDSEKYKDKENLVMEQMPKKNETLMKGDTITLYIPDIVVTFPDFVNGNYTIQEVQAFCDQNGIILNITYKETDLEKEGKILEQDRPEGYKALEGTVFTITVAKEVKTQTPPVDDVDGES